jgi:hypothetical protein
LARFAGLALSALLSFDSSSIIARTTDDRVHASRSRQCVIS